MHTGFNEVKFILFNNQVYQHNKSKQLKNNDNGTRTSVESSFIRQVSSDKSLLITKIMIDI